MSALPPPSTSEVLDKSGLITVPAGVNPVPVLAPGNGKTKTGRFWDYLRDEWPQGGKVPAGRTLPLHAGP
jgi:hypothetical protein